MKICFVNPTRLQRPIYVVAKRLADRGHTVTVLQPEGMIQRYPSWENVSVISLPCRYVPEARYTLPSLGQEYRILEQLVREQKYDLIHVQDYQNLTALPPVWIKRRLGVPITLVNNALVGVDWHYGKLLFDQIARLYTYTVGRLILRAYDRLFFLYRRLAFQTAKLLGCRIPPWEVVPIGVDTACFYHVPDSGLHKQLQIPDAAKVILFVGRLSAVKRVEWVIDLTRRLHANGRQVQTIIVGGGKLGNLATENYLRRLAEPLGPAVLFTGPVSQSDLRQYYSIAHVVVLPSLSEGLPNVLLEAGACRTPCVASDVGGVAEIIQQGETGYFFPPAEFDAFVNRVETILNDPLRIGQMGVKAQESVLSHFEWDKIVDRYELAFQHVVGRHYGLL